MRELHERDAGDGADGTDSRPDVAVGQGGDSRRQAIAIVRDAATRTALALEYRRRVEAGDAASGAAVAASPDERGVRAYDTSGKGDHVSGPPTGRDTGDRGDDHRTGDLRSQDIAWRPTREPTFPQAHGICPNARDVLPNLEMAELDARKLSEYSLKPGHPAITGRQMAGGHSVTMWTTRRAPRCGPGAARTDLRRAAGARQGSRDPGHCYGPSHRVISGHYRAER